MACMSISHPQELTLLMLLALQLSVKGHWNWNSTLEERTQQYQLVTDHAQAFRDITPGGGAYFVSPLHGSQNDLSLTSINCRMRAMYTNLTTRTHTGAITTPFCS